MRYDYGMQVVIRHTSLVTAAQTQYGAAQLPPDLGVWEEVQKRTVGNNMLADLPVRHLDPFWIDLRDISGQAAILIAVQNVNPKTGQPAYQSLQKYPQQNYYVLPDPRSPWVDGWALPGGRVSQFVFVDKESGLSVAEYLLPAGLVGDQLAVAVYRPVYQPPVYGSDTLRGGGLESDSANGVGAGGDIVQEHRADFNDLRYWKSDPEVVFTWTMVAKRGRQTGQGFLSGLPHV